jgi:hypothetical protein
MMSTETANELSDAIRDVFTSEDRRGGDCEPANVVDTVHELAEAVRYGLKWLGNADACTPMGALEAHGKVIMEAGEQVASALVSIATAVDGLADAIREHGAP